MSSIRSERTRRAVLGAAWRCLADPGTDRSGLEDVAAEAGVTRQTLYRHFGSRSGLLTALVAHIDDELGLGARIDQVRALDDPVQALEATLALTASYQPQIHGVALALERLAWDDADARAAIEDRMEHRRGGLREVVGAVAAAGRLVPGWSVDDVVDVLWEAGAPSSWQHLVGERGWTPERFERWLVHLARSFVVPAP